MNTPRLSNITRQTWAWSGGVALTVAIAALWETLLLPSMILFPSHSLPVMVASVTILATATGLYRIAPGSGLILAWFMAAFVVAGHMPVMLTYLLLTVLAYGCARYGSTITCVASALSIPAIAALVAALLLTGSTDWLVDDIFMNDRGVYIAGRLGWAQFAYARTFLILIGTLLIIGWFIGLVARVMTREKLARAESEAATQARDQATELAHVREQQTQLARDVHDVVGHSLTVILAQAESAQFLPDDDPERVKRTLTTIADSARASLQDVRHVLGATDERRHFAELDELISGVRRSGHEVVMSERGEPRPLPPDLQVVTYRVLQEMLTNAIRHGERSEPIVVTLQWHDGLRVEVRNGVAADNATVLLPSNGHDSTGIDGMRRRLEAVDGTLDVRPASPGRPTFTTTAWIPLGAR